MTAKSTMCDSPTELETAGLSATTAVVMLAQKAGFPHGVAGAARSTAGPDVWAGIWCSQVDGIARSDCSHSSGRTTGKIWPVSIKIARNRTSERCMCWQYTPRGAGRNRTDESRFCRPLPYHLATAPNREVSPGPSATSRWPRSLAPPRVRSRSSPRRSAVSGPRRAPGSTESDPSPSCSRLRAAPSTPCAAAR